MACREFRRVSAGVAGNEFSMEPRAVEGPIDGDRLFGFRCSLEQVCSNQWLKRTAQRNVSFRCWDPGLAARDVDAQRCTLNRSALRTAFPRVRSAWLACLGMLLGSTAVAQEVLSIPVNAAGELQPPPGVQLERTGVIGTLAGTGLSDHVGDGGPAVAAQFRFPRSLALDPTGNIYVVDTRSHRVRRIDTAGEISTFAGTGEDGDSGDGGPATEAQLCFPAAVAVDSDGNVFVADSWNHRIRKIDIDGIITTIAGTGAPRTGGDGGPATEAQIAHPAAVALDRSGNLYVAEARSHRIRRIDADGTITTLAGTGVAGYRGDGGPASRSRLAYPAGIAVGPAGSVYVADSWNHRIRRILPSGVISTVAGTGERGDGGDGGPALQAQIAYPVAVASDTKGNLFVVSFVPDRGNHRIRKIDAGGTISAFAGDGVQGYGGDGDPAPAARLAYPLGVAADTEGNVYIADSQNARIRIVRPGLQVRLTMGASGESVTLVVGAGGVLRRGGQPVPDGSEVMAGNGNTYALTKSSAGAVVATYVPETQAVPLRGGDVTISRDEDGTWRIGENRVENGHRHEHQGKDYVLELADGQWRLAEYTIETVAGTTPIAPDGAPATSAILFGPADVALDSAGNVFVAELSGHRIRRISRSGLVTTIAGSGDWGFSGDGGPATQARLNHPISVAVDAFGNCYVAESEGHRIRMVERSGVITTIAGTGRSGNEGDGGPAIEAAVELPNGVAVDRLGVVYVATGNRIRRIDGSGVITTFAGTGDWGSHGDGGAAVHAGLADPRGIALDTEGNVYVAEWTGQRIRRIDRSGVITTLAGTGELGSSGDGGPAIEARVNHPLGVATDTAGNVYVAEEGSGRIRRIDPTGMITTVAGTGEPGFDAESGPAIATQIHAHGVATRADGNVYVADIWSGRIREIDGSGMLRTLAGTWGPGPVGGPANEAVLDHPRGAVVRASGELVFGEWGSLWKLDAAGLVSRLALTADEGVTNLEGVEDIALDAAGNLYVAEESGRRVRRIDSAGRVIVFAGTGEPGYAGDGGPATEARFDRPVSVAVDSLGNVYVADQESHRVRRIDVAGVITTFAGTGDPGSSGDTGPATEARLESPVAVTAGPGGNVFIADGWGWRIRRVDRSGLINTLAEAGIETSHGALATDSAGRVYAGGRRQIRRIDSDGAVSVIAGTGDGGFSGDGGPALSAGLSVSGITLSRSGDVWLVDAFSRRIRVLRRQSP